MIMYKCSKCTTINRDMAGVNYITEVRGEGRRRRRERVHIQKEHTLLSRTR